MGVQYDRALTLSVGGSLIAQLDGDPDACLRVRFEILQRNAQAPNRALITVSNLSDATAEKLTKERLPVELSAGYRDNIGLLFKGTTTNVVRARESVTDTILQIQAGDGEIAYNHGVISKALAKGSTPLDHVNAFVDALKPFGITKGYLPTQLLSQPKYPRGVSFAGMVRDHARTLALSYGCQWSIQNGAFQMVPAASYVPGSPFLVNATSGMIGMPSQTPQGILVRVLINPSINLQSGNLIHLNNKDINKALLDQSIPGQAANLQIPRLAEDGVYRVLEITPTGDTRGRDWYMDLVCLNKDLAGFVPAGQVFNLSSAEQADAQKQNDKLLGKN